MQNKVNVRGVYFDNLTFDETMEKVKSLVKEDGVSVMFTPNSEIVQNCIENKEMSIIISSHNLRELEDICDTFAILEDSHIETSGSIEDTKETIHKIQVAFNSEIKKEDFNELDIMHYHSVGRIVTLIVKGDLETTKEIIQKMNPLMMDILPVNLEEIFIYEMERKGVFVNE